MVTLDHRMTLRYLKSPLPFLLYMTVNSLGISLRLFSCESFFWTWWPSIASECYDCRLSFAIHKCNSIIDTAIIGLWLIYICWRTFSLIWFIFMWWFQKKFGSQWLSRPNILAFTILFFRVGLFTFTPN